MGSSRATRGFACDSGVRLDAQQPSAHPHSGPYAAGANGRTAVYGNAAPLPGMSLAPLLWSLSTGGQHACSKNPVVGAAAPSGPAAAGGSVLSAASAVAPQPGILLAPLLWIRSTGGPAASENPEVGAPAPSGPAAAGWPSAAAPSSAAAPCRKYFSASVHVVGSVEARFRCDGWQFPPMSLIGLLRHPFRYWRSRAADSFTPRARRRRAIWSCAAVRPKSSGRRGSPAGPAPRACPNPEIGGSHLVRACGSCSQSPLLPSMCRASLASFSHLCSDEHVARCALTRACAAVVLRASSFKSPLLAEHVARRALTEPTPLSFRLHPSQPPAGHFQSPLLAEHAARRQQQTPWRAGGCEYTMA